MQPPLLQAASSREGRQTASQLVSKVVTQSVQSRKWGEVLGWGAVGELSGKITCEGDLEKPEEEEGTTPTMSILEANPVSHRGLDIAPLSFTPETQRGPLPLATAPPGLPAGPLRWPQPLILQPSQPHRMASGARVPRAESCAHPHRTQCRKEQ